MRSLTRVPLPSKAFSMVELQVALALLGIALAGVVPLVVVQSKQIRRLEAHLDDDVTYYVTPPPERWASRLGAA
ncbi:MAG: prepilin-type N-terminal cleavage/methylation domain-containing protein, partial [Thermoguttaceae bacterium]|nr:prepilin-type N-terminal cleavage/methylation domain-containing protein [Thermoguttaceae bacterium]